MEKELYYARIKYDAETVGEKLKAVIEAHEKLMNAISEYENAARNGLQVNLRQAASITSTQAGSFVVADGVTDRPNYQRMT